MQIIEQLQASRPEIVHVFDEIVKTLPDGVFYTKLTTKGKVIGITGIAESNNRVSSLMRRLDASDWLADPNLDKVQAEPDFGDQANKFNLTVKIELPTSGTEADQG